MNIEQANDIALIEILQKLGVQPSKHDGADLMYLSPLRKERTPSFHVNQRINKWFDHGIGEGGNSIDLVISYLKYQREDHTVHDALRWLTLMFGSTPPTIIHSEERTFVNEQTLRLRKVTPLQSAVFINYLQARGIALHIAKKYLKEVEVLNTKSGKTFIAIGLKNEDEGYELRNKNFKGSVRSKYVSVIRGSDPESKAIHIFEGLMDFLSALVYQKKTQFAEDAIILNSVSLIGKAYPYINNYGYLKLYSWLDNDHQGQNAATLLKDYLEKHSTITFVSMNKLYKGHKDVNEWLMHTKKLQPYINIPKG